MARIIVTSDLHFDPAGQLTPPEMIRRLADRVRAEGPDLVVLAGDLAHGLGSFEECVKCFANVGAPVCVLSGNHDVWRDRERRLGSAILFESKLEEAAVAQGAIWLEGRSFIVDGVATVGTTAWYDYSAIDPSFRVAPDEIRVRKREFNNDAYWIDWPWTDQELCARISTRFLDTLREAQDSPTIRAIIVVTHVPILEEQMTRKPQDPGWSFSNAYFGNLTLGRKVVEFEKVKAIVSGHTHIGRKAWIARQSFWPIDCRVIGSDYGNPSYEVLDIA